MPWPRPRLWWCVLSLPNAAFDLSECLRTYPAPTQPREDFGVAGIPTLFDRASREIAESTFSASIAIAGPHRAVGAPLTKLAAFR
jgi:hypothetical protein